MSEPTADGPGQRATIDAAAELAARLLDDGITILPRREVTGRVKDELGVEGVAHGAVREGFESAGWEYSRHLYLHPERLREGALALAEELSAVNHLVVTEEEVVDRIAEPIERGDEAGWRRGEAVAVLRGAFEDEGWMVREVGKGGAARTFYLLPLLSVIEDLHPNGRPPFSADEIFRYYVSQSIRGTVSE